MSTPEPKVQHFSVYIQCDLRIVILTTVYDDVMIKIMANQFFFYQ